MPPLPSACEGTHAAPRTHARMRHVVGQVAAAAIVACIDGHTVLDAGACVPDEETTAVFAKL